MYRMMNQFHFDGLVQDCSNSIANALELLQSYTKPLICHYLPKVHRRHFQWVPSSIGSADWGSAAAGSSKRWRHSLPYLIVMILPALFLAWIFFIPRPAGFRQVRGAHLPEELLHFPIQVFTESDSRALQQFARFHHIPFCVPVTKFNNNRSFGILPDFTKSVSNFDIFLRNLHFQMFLYYI